MFSRIYFMINLIRGIPAYLVLCLSGAKEIIEKETQRYLWFLEENTDTRFFSCFHRLMCRYDCYRNHVIYRCFEKSKVSTYILRLLFPPKKDLEIGGEIAEGLVVYHGHGAVIAPHKVGKNFSVYQGVTIGGSRKEHDGIRNPIIGDNVEIYTNAVVAGGIIIGDNVTIGAGAVVMKDVPSNSIVMGNPCIIKQKK